MPTHSTCKWTPDKIDTAKRLVASEASTREIHRATGLSMRSVQKFVKEYLETGKFEIRKRGRKEKSNDRLKGELQRILTEDSNLTLEQINSSLSEDLKTSTSTLSYTLKSMKWSKKRVHIQPAERNSAQQLQRRRAYVTEVSHRRDEDLIFLDETGFNLHTQPKFGWAPLDVTPYQVCPGNRGRNISVLAAISVRGVLRFIIVEGAVNSVVMKHFLEDLRSDMRPESLLIMDNARIHHAGIVVDFLMQNNMHYKFLPPYSPQLNPIEELFSMAKAKFRQVRPRPTTTGQLKASVEQVFNDLNETALYGLYSHMRSYFNDCFNMNPIF